MTRRPKAGKRQPMFTGEKLGNAIGIGLLIIFLAVWFTLGSQWFFPG